MCGLGFRMCGLGFRVWMEDVGLRGLGLRM